ncbi:MAG: metalloprotease [Actinobacteria bacterium]|nr:metalloprotease [Actinomycetota bacterium]
MKWTGRRQSGNVSDKRLSGRMIGGVGGLIVVGLMLFGLFTGTDTSGLIDLAQTVGGTTQTETRELTAQEQRELDYVETIVADTEDVWNEIFLQNDMDYREPQLVLYRDSVQTESGSFASAAMGPFYMPSEETIYLDMSFFEQLRTEFGARVKTDVSAESGDFVVAYVIAHEVGHHVQKQLGIADAVAAKQATVGQTEANQLSVAMELQADFFAGVFAHEQQQILESGDIDAALNAAAVIGDDAIQRKTQGQVVPDSFTHGTSEQRAYWFNLGYQTGDINQGDTFKEVLGESLS